MQNHIQNVTLYPNEVHQEIKISSIEELSELVKRANDEKLSLYPISTGFNWGMGSKVPVSKNSIIVDLSALNQIRNYDSSSGTVEIEPGVTQEQLMQFLKEQGGKHFIDVTGSSKSTSILGNALERGVTYNAQRNERILALEVITGKGDKIKTGSWKFENSKIAHLYPHGIGPNLTECFIQSNFGIVTKAIIKLFKVKKINKTVLISFKSKESLLNNLEGFNHLMEENVIDSIFHIANKPRMIDAVLPQIEKKMNSLGEPFNKEKAINLLTSNIKQDWNASGFISANSRIEYLFKKRSLKKSLQDCKIQFLDLRLLNFIENNISKLKRIKLFQFVFGIIEFKSYYTGRASDAALGSVTPNKVFLSDDFHAVKVDEATQGFAFCLPLMPLKKYDANIVLDLTKAYGEKYNFDVACTLNPIKEGLLEAVISISYQQDKFLDSRKFIREIQKDLNALGYYSYRTNIKDMDLYSETKSTSYIREIKSIFDPSSIISPGRYI